MIKQIDWGAVKRWCWQAFKPAVVAMIVALLTTLGYLGLEQSREPTLVAAGTTHFSNLSVTGDAAVGDDLTVTDDASVAGDLTVTGATVYSGGYSYTGEIEGANGLLLTGNLTQTSGSALLNALAVTRTLSANTLEATNAVTVGAQLVAGNGVDVTGDVTVTGDLSVGDVAVGDELSVAGVLYADDDLEVAGAATCVSTLSANTLEVTDCITVGADVAAVNVNASGEVYGVGVATFDHEVYVGDGHQGLHADGNVTVTQNLTVTGWAGFGGTYFAVSSTVAYTDDQTIIVVANKTIYPVTAGGPTATLSSTVSISDGFYLGQMIVICNVDTLAHSLVVKDGANTKISGDVTLYAEVGSAPNSLPLWWDGADWRFFGDYTP